MSRTERHEGKGGGFDYGSKRLGNKGYANSPGDHKAGKVKTKRMERQAEREFLHREIIMEGNYGRPDFAG